MPGNHLIFSVNNQGAATCEIWKSLWQVKWGRGGCFMCVKGPWPDSISLPFTVRKGKKKEKAHIASKGLQIQSSWQMEETIRSLRHTYCNWLRATTRASPAIYTVGMITPSVKWYQPKPHGKQLCIFIQTLKEICIKYVTSSFPTRNYPLNKSKHRVPIKSSATTTLSTVEPTDVCKKKIYIYNLEIYERNSATIVHLPAWAIKAARVAGHRRRKQKHINVSGCVVCAEREKEEKKTAEREASILRLM